MVANPYSFTLTRCAAMFFASGIVILTGMGCSCQEKKSSQQPVSPRSSFRPPPDSVNSFYAPIKTLSLDGNPIPGIIPIVTLSPNAFDKPIAEGLPTDTEGRSSIRFDLKEKVALRAWDKSLKYFPNNFYDILPGSGISKEELVITMVESSTMEAVLMLPTGLPAINENVGIMMFHPVHGPWWPAEADTNDKGEVVFNNIPPGSYVLRLKIGSGSALETPETFIKPGDTTHLGILYLQ